MSQRLAVLLLAVSFPATAEIYRWTDANGQVHFGDSAAGAGQPAPAVALPAAGDRPARRGDPDRGTDAQEQQARAERLQRLRAAQREDDAAQENAVAQAAHTKAEHDRRCQQLRAEVQAMAGRPVYVSDAQGERHYLDDTQRRSYEDQVHRHLQAHCP